jgi:hypothetical protein
MTSSSPLVRRATAVATGLLTLAVAGFVAFISYFSRMGMQSTPSEGALLLLEQGMILLWAAVGLWVAVQLWRGNWSRIGKALFGAIALTVVAIPAWYAIPNLIRSEPEQTQTAVPDMPVPDTTALGDLPVWAASFSTLDAHVAAEGWLTRPLRQNDAEFEEITTARWQGEMLIVGAEYSDNSGLSGADHLLTGLSAVPVSASPAGPQSGWLLLGVRELPPVQGAPSFPPAGHILRLSVWVEGSREVLQHDLILSGCGEQPTLGVYEFHESGTDVRLTPDGEAPVWLNVDALRAGGDFEMLVASVVGRAAMAGSVWSVIEENQSVYLEGPYGPDTVEGGGMLAEERGYFRPTGKIDGDFIEAEWIEWDAATLRSLPDASSPACVREVWKMTSRDDGAPEPQPLRVQPVMFQVIRGDAVLVSYNTAPCWC